MTTQTMEDAHVASSGARWMQLVLGIIGMVMIANLQYGWTLFVGPIDDKYHWGRAAIQVSFTLFVLMETWLVPFEGYLIDRFGPKIVVGVAGALCALAWVVNARADSLPLLYLGNILGGIGAGAVYGASIGNALKWFPDKRGLAAGLTAGGFGIGAAFTVVPIANTIATHGYQAAFLWFGLFQGVVVIIAGLFLRAPLPGETPKPVVSASVQSSREYTPPQAMKTGVFWVMYAMFVMVGTGGLMAAAQLAPIATDYGVDKVPVSLLGLTLPALTFALSLDRIMNGITRPFFGWISDHIGRENTMFIAFAIEGLGIYALMQFANQPLLFVILTGLVFFAWGEAYSLFPATCTDTYGRKYATTNYGLLYTSKGMAALLVPFGNVIATATGSWTLVLEIASVLNIIAALTALLVLKPLRKRLLAQA